MNIQLHHADCRDILPTIDPATVDALISDPPYGIALKTDYRRRKRGKLTPANNYAPIAGDDRPFDPAHLLAFKTVVLFGANYYAHLLPPSPGWIVWDKLNGLTSRREWGFNDNADVELIWTNVHSAARIVPHRWMGMLKESEQTERRVHPTQKPVALMVKLIERFTKEGDTVIDPYMGSGSTGVAAVLTGRNFIGIEINRGYVDIARVRIDRARAHARSARALPLFSGEGGFST